jgi:hypothetical protein
MDNANSFSTVKSASASIAFFIKSIYILITLPWHPKFVW